MRGEMRAKNRGTRRSTRKRGRTKWTRPEIEKGRRPWATYVQASITPVSEINEQTQLIDSLDFGMTTPYRATVAISRIKDNRTDDLILLKDQTSTPVASL